MNKNNFIPQVKQVNRTPIKKHNGWLKKLHYDEKEKDYVLASVIVTAASSSSYDQLFEKEKQQAPEGCRIGLYFLDLQYISNFRDYLINDTYPNDEYTAANLKDLKKELSEVEASCVLFNFECCEYFSCGFNNINTSQQKYEDVFEDDMQNIECQTTNESVFIPPKNIEIKEKIKEKITKKIDSFASGYGFPDKKSMNDCLKEFIKKGYYIMFGDYSLKALINDWDEMILGPNPLVNIGENSSNMMLEFEPKQLKDCESVQLQSVGKICPKGELKLSCMGGTIVVGLDKSKIEDQKTYKYETLTIAINHKTYNPESYNEKYMYYHLHGNRGTLGHGSFKYETGSVLFISAGHWIELHEVDSNVDDMKKYAQENWGEDNEMFEELNQIYHL